uniref:Uncharacterized protein n=1 Tax=Rhizophora mucronata TaxID=61149 RepID=A0A2P2IN31_RHIMU
MYLSRQFALKTDLRRLLRKTKKEKTRSAKGNRVK